MSTGKGIKRTRNQPVFYEELKKKRGIMLTATAWENLVIAAKNEKISVSEYIERLARKIDVKAE
ncbi:MAG: hypothetical protein KME64_41790 [Scytonematopsis contorta HA4267-MV1]|jgi:hypothetical protein|nr:hypothetical protein [Scytonematopsis contorta HA4267-MV1]